MFEPLPVLMECEKVGVGVGKARQWKVSLIPGLSRREERYAKLVERKAKSRGASPLFLTGNCRRKPLFKVSLQHNVVVSQEERAEQSSQAKRGPHFSPCNSHVVWEGLRCSYTFCRGHRAWFSWEIIGPSWEVKVTSQQNGDEGIGYRMW
jgi:hypothetical protein